MGKEVIMNTERKKRRYLIVTIERKSLIAGASVLLLSGIALKLSSETITLTTAYPSPSGIYQKLTSTGQTILARNTGNVGVGTATPGVKLDVLGSARVAGNVLVTGNAQVTGNALVVGNFTLANGSQAAGQVLTSNANGTGTWAAGSGAFVTTVYTFSGSGSYTCPGNDRVLSCTSILSPMGSYSCVPSISGNTCSAGSCLTLPGILNSYYNTVVCGGLH